jgi:hypothetical protein
MQRRMHAGELVQINTSDRPTVRPILTDDEIARRAYEIFQSRGERNGADLEDWLQAESELMGRTAKAS